MVLEGRVENDLGLGTLGEVYVGSREMSGWVWYPMIAVDGGGVVCAQAGVIRGEQVVRVFRCPLRTMRELAAPEEAVRKGKMRFEDGKFGGGDRRLHLAYDWRHGDSLPRILYSVVNIEVLFGVTGLYYGQSAVFICHSEGLGQCKCEILQSYNNTEFSFSRLPQYRDPAVFDESTSSSIAGALPSALVR